MGTPMRVRTRTREREKGEVVYREGRGWVRGNEGERHGLGGRFQAQRRKKQRGG